MKKNMKNGLLALFIGLVLLSGCESKKDTIHIATKPMSEQFILGEMLALLIEENSDLHVKITKGVGGGTSNIHPAMVKGDFDLYPEYTGTGWLVILKKDTLLPPDQLFSELQKEYSREYGLKWVAPYGFNNAYSLAVSNEMAKKYDMPILYSCHPRSRKFIEQRGFVFDERVIQHQPLGFHDYNHLQMNAFAVVSDSGTLPEESSYFLSIGHPFPAVCIRTSTERPEALDKGNFILAGITTEQVLQAVDVAVEMNRAGALGIPVDDYTGENVSVKVVKLIQSYTGVVDKMVWRKY